MGVVKEIRPDSQAEPGIFSYPIAGQRVINDLSRASICYGQRLSRLSDRYFGGRLARVATNRCSL
jgi:hypothetical protein